MIRDSIRTRAAAPLVPVLCLVAAWAAPPARGQAEPAPVAAEVTAQEPAAPEPGVVPAAPVVPEPDAVPEPAAAPEPAAPAIEPESAPPPSAPSLATLGIADEPPVPVAPEGVVPAPVVDRRALNPCDQPPEDDAKAIDKARLGLWKTTCRAVLWFDGLFGEERHPLAASNTTGRVETSYVYSEYEGSKVRGRFNVRMRFPNLSNHVEAFVGRDDDFVRDRNEGFALRSQFLGIDDDERWLAGFGYGLPGSYRQRSDFRVGANGGRTPEVFVQGRHRRNWYIGERDLWHFRETVFWTNRDGFGSTTSLDFDHLLHRTLLLRWGTIGTVSEATDGLDWRSAWVLYHDLGSRRALAYETFLRGETRNEVELTEYGARVIYRQSIFGREWLYGELVGGYSWPRFYRDDPREGSAAVGVGIEMLFGRGDAGP